MAAITILTPSPGSKRGGLYESVSITNQATDSVAVLKAIEVPSFARYCTFLVDLTAVGGTSPLFDFVVYGYNAAANSFAAPDDGFLYVLGAGWDGITQKTAASQSTIHIGPDITTDDAGSATADDAYGVGAVLPEYLVYKYTTDGTTDDEDYTATISAFFRGF